MNGFLVGIAAMVVISVGAAIVLNNLDYSSQSQFSSPYVRLGN